MIDSGIIMDTKLEHMNPNTVLFNLVKHFIDKEIFPKFKAIYPGIANMDKFDELIKNNLILKFDIFQNFMVNLWIGGTIPNFFTNLMELINNILRTNGYPID